MAEKTLKDKRLYVCSNHGEYAQFERYLGKGSYCSWHPEPCGADIFKNYQDAYNHAKRINKWYGFNRVSVEKLVPSEWKPEYWERLKQAESDRNIEWWRQDQRRHNFSGVRW